MFILTSNMFGLAILSLGILGVIVSLLIANRRRFLIGISLSGLLVVLGIFYVVDTSFRQWLTARRISKIQEQNRESLEALKARMQETSKTSTPAASAEAKSLSAPARQKRR
ncbi:MAG: hypothetical protein IPN90_04185 [Elusimicrobia bacterium]|nr:hypothetical protein [Elusimicrobiota bacterium]